MLYRPVLLLRMKRHAPSACGSPPSKRKAGATGSAEERGRAHAYGATSSKYTTTRGVPPWSTKLLDSMKDPAMIVQSDDLMVTIKDAYPKARHHYLVLPKENIPHLRALGRLHVPLLENMLANGRKLAEEVKDKEGKRATFRYGYHASPSMTRLHMHVVSQDLDSPCLKNKKHWNSFTSGFFLDAERVISILQEEGKVELDVKGVYEPMLKSPLKCHVCHKELQNMPKLKEHIKLHL